MMKIEEEKAMSKLDELRIKDLVARAEYYRLIAEVKAIIFLLEKKHAVETSNGEE
jgi:hypothetical protein